MGGINFIEFSQSDFYSFIFILSNTFNFFNKACMYKKAVFYDISLAALLVIAAIVGISYSPAAQEEALRRRSLAFGYL